MFYNLNATHIEKSPSSNSLLVTVTIYINCGQLGACPSLWSSKNFLTTKPRSYSTDDGMARGFYEFDPISFFLD